MSLVNPERLRAAVRWLTARRGPPPVCAWCGGLEFTAICLVAQRCCDEKGIEYSSPPPVDREWMSTCIPVLVICCDACRRVEHFSWKPIAAALDRDGT